ncbi:MAG: Lrp/AsnC family transcriptional regulator [Sarcina sp.]
MKIDNIDLEIINLLKNNSKITFKEIGEILHMTGQAIGLRVTKLQDENIIQNFTININKNKLENTITSFITIYMTTADHSRIKNLITKTPEIQKAYRVAGDGCYIIEIETTDNSIINKIIKDITEFANYKISNVLAELK